MPRAADTAIFGRLAAALPGAQGCAITSSESAAPIPDSDTILVVDDDVSARRLVVRVLEEAGYAVLEADSPSHALALAGDGTHRIALLLTDVRMPHMDGVELAQRFHRLVPQARVLLMSGYHDLRDIAHPLIAKPFIPAELLDLVGATLAIG